MFYNGNWIHSFPQNYQWSNAILVCKGMAPYGAVAMGEIDIVTQKLHARGPMGLAELTTTTYIVTGDGQIRE